ncbi:hypothetical protein [Thiothrix unzii]|uniref:Tetratricopeptide repeat protein n=1 Tax=Thiothrix unzii TaxID=111769 RepID=A0A975F8Q5_9GAMM|nr:hypothetical protein [Thiothrix unzii]QTR53485.1 hypothetical protein J9260_17575 [Thiothrix unzii]
MTYTHSNLTTSKLLAIALFALLAITLFLYSSGLHSPFILDDTPNLSSMGQHERLGIWHDLALYILNSNTGPTGRPISLASFYINDSSWSGAVAADFKYTNLMLHLLNGVLLFWLSMKLAALTSLTDKAKAGLAFGATALWLLHPMQVNTVLYVVQRMTELSALFTLTGLLFYLHGRKQLATSPVKAWASLVLGVGCSLLLAMLSKENGILLVVYILVVEYFLLRPLNASAAPGLIKPLLLMVWLPFAALAFFLLFVVTQTKNYAERPFTLEERLLSETRVLWDYIANILLPRLNGNTLFHDDFVTSTSWLTPHTTLPAVLGIILLILIPFLIRKSQPVTAFAIAWFLGGHLLESTTIALELYFEHRNYLPLYGFAFAIAYYLLLGIQHLPKLQMVFKATFVVYLLLLAGITFHNAQRWTNPTEMALSWLEQHPRSQRTLEMVESLVGEHLAPEVRQNLQTQLKQSSLDSNTSSYLIIKKLIDECQTASITPQHLETALTELQTAGYVDVASELYANLAAQWTEHQCQQQLTANNMLKFSHDLQQIAGLQKGHMPYLLAYWQAQIQLTQGNLEETMQHMEAAYALRPDVDLMLLQATYLASAGLVEQAINKLAQAEHDLCNHWRSCLILKVRQPDIDNMKAVLEQRLQQEIKVTKHEQAKLVDYPARQE